ATMAAPPLTEGDIRLKARVAMDAATLKVTDVAATWGGIKLDGESAWAAKDGFDHVASQVDVAIAGEKLATMPKAFEGRIAAKGRMGALEVSVDGSTPQLVLPGGALESFTLKASASQARDTWSGAITAAGQRGETPVTFNATLSQPTPAELAV